MWILRHSAIAFLALLLSIMLRAQDNWDSVLDRYEEICGRCIELRGRITTGESVPNAEVTQLLGELGRLRSLIQDSQGSMSAAQRQRFGRIRSRYDASSPGDAGANDSGKVAASKKAGNTRVTRKKAVPEASTITRSPSNLPQGRGIEGTPPLKLDVPASSGITARSIASTSTIEDTKASLAPLYGPIRTDIIPVAELSTRPAFGLFASVAKERWGGYLSARSTFTDMGVSYRTSADGSIDGGGKFWSGGNSRYGSWTVSAGPIWHPFDALGVYVGAGYGNKSLDWQDTEGHWARVNDYSYAGLGIEAGAIASLHRFDLLAGACWLGGWSFLVGVGYSF